MIKNMMKSSKQKGFTLVELLVVVVIIGILASIALPNFISAQNKAKESSVKGNMRTAQVAAESYATDFAGIYPNVSFTSDYESYFPGGGNDASTSGNPLTNPISNTTGWPVSGAVMTTTSIAGDRTGITALVIGGCGIEYNETNDAASDVNGYAIMGEAINTNGVNGNGIGTTLVLSNM
jgi:prepilin-type N-terminal cleavage/methylation domain-containing protein